MLKKLYDELHCYEIMLDVECYIQRSADNTLQTMSIYNPTCHGYDDTYICIYITYDVCAKMFIVATHYEFNDIVYDDMHDNCFIHSTYFGEHDAIKALAAKIINLL